MKATTITTTRTREIERTKSRAGSLPWNRLEIRRSFTSMTDNTVFAERGVIFVDGERQTVDLLWLNKVTPSDGNVVVFIQTFSIDEGAPNSNLEFCFPFWISGLLSVKLPRSTTKSGCRFRWFNNLTYYLLECILHTARGRWTGYFWLADVVREEKASHLFDLGSYRRTTTGPTIFEL